jgi:hypothetical protein
MKRGDYAKMKGYLGRGKKCHGKNGMRIEVKIDDKNDGWTERGPKGARRRPPLEPMPRVRNKRTGAGTSCSAGEKKKSTSPQS